ncbi:hypothetical protein GUITHDRAFT_151239 [Guillardia theta CCMP2712]|uniref:Uncharacterized protein n=3 Tax=Guillardia theta TaxID=55529 RepID=L1JNL2_GUITC|nr:hypothetical protein GUITHDRAFT_151239 [Guillardia theta CCMP2712]EKX50176.1 hypothetical protein GUITHDRAFT_151239 [Guillardia theta CCMP2712]|eukprot:XP_005837156.1 hypothetical protein GUITHDRAFT_151239 [Guillardia theta CCMP2712]
MPNGRSLSVDKCVMKGAEKATELVEENGDQHPAFLSILLLFFLSLFGNAGLLACCWSYRKRYFETKIARHYDIFQG